MAMSQVCRRIVIVAYRYTGKNTVKRRRGGGTTRAHGSHRRTSQPTQPTNATTRTTARRPRILGRSINSRSPGRADRTSPPIAPRGPDSEEAASLPLATAQRATTPPGGLSGSFSEGLVPVGSASPWPVRLGPSRARAPNGGGSRVSLAARHREWLRRAPYRVSRFDIESRFDSTEHFTHNSRQTSPPERRAWQLLSVSDLNSDRRISSYVGTIPTQSVSLKAPAACKRSQRCRA